MNNTNTCTFETYQFMANLKPLFNKIQEQHYRYVPFFLLVQRHVDLSGCVQDELSSLALKLDEYLTDQEPSSNEYAGMTLPTQLGNLESKTSLINDDVIGSLSSSRTIILEYAPGIISSLASIPLWELIKIIDAVSSLNLRITQREFSDFCEELFRYISDQIHLPEEVSNFMTSHVTSDYFWSGESTFAPYCQDANILLTLKSIERGNSAIKDRSELGIFELLGKCWGLSEDPLPEDEKWNYDVMLATPPFGRGTARETFSEFPTLEAACVQRICDEMTSEGKAVILVSSKFLAARRPSMCQLREHLVSRNVLDSVILMPANILRSNSMGFAFLVLDNNRKEREEMTFVDAAQFFYQHRRKRIFSWPQDSPDFDSHSVDANTKIILTRKDLERENYDFRPSKYLSQRDIDIPDDYTKFDLRDLVRLQQGEKIGEQIRGRLISLKDIFDNADLESTAFEEVKPRTISEFNEGQKSSQGMMAYFRECLLIDPLTRGGELSCCWYKPQGTESVPIFVHNDIYVMEVEAFKVSAAWLLIALRADITRQQVRGLVRDAGLPRISRRDLESLKIAVPKLKTDQNAIVEATRTANLQAEIKEAGLYDLIEQNRQEFLDDLRMKKHHLSQFVNDIQSGISTVLKLLNKKGSLAAEDIISRHSGIPLGAYLSDIKQKTLSLGANVESLTQRVSLLEPELLDLRIILPELAGKYSNERFQIEIDISEIYFGENGGNAIASPIVSIASANLEMIFDNIVSNAKRHGFVELDKDYKIFIEVACDDDPINTIDILFSNNGKSMPEGMNTKSYVRPGDMGGATGNTGLGGSHVKTILDHVGGSVQLANDPNSPYPVGILIKLPMQYE